MSIIETIYKKLKAAPPEIVQEVLDFLEALETRGAPPTTAPATSWVQIVASLPGSTGFNDDPLAIQRQIRAEWDDAT